VAKCGHCRQSIQPTSVVCPFCGKSTTEFRLPVALGLLLIAVVIVVGVRTKPGGAADHDDSNRQNPRLQQPPTTDTAPRKDPIVATGIGSLDDLRQRFPEVIASVDTTDSVTTIVVKSDVWYYVPLSSRLALADRFLDVYVATCGNDRGVLHVVDERDRLVAEEEFGDIPFTALAERLGRMKLIFENNPP